jgi:hypothetical protein
LARAGQELSQAAWGRFADQLSVWLVSRYAVIARRLEVQDPEASWGRLRQLFQDVVALRPGDHRLERLREGERRKQELTEAEHRNWVFAPGRLEELNREAQEAEKAAGYLQLNTDEEIYKARVKLFGEAPGDPRDPRTARELAERAAAEAGAARRVEAARQAAQKAAAAGEQGKKQNQGQCTKTNQDSAGEAAGEIRNPRAGVTSPAAGPGGGAPSLEAEIRAAKPWPVNEGLLARLRAMQVECEELRPRVIKAGGAVTLELSWRLNRLDAEVGRAIKAIPLAWRQAWKAMGGCALLLLVCGRLWAGGWGEGEIRNPRAEIRSAEAASCGAAVRAAAEGQGKPAENKAKQSRTNREIPRLTGVAMGEQLWGVGAKVDLSAELNANRDAMI